MLDISQGLSVEILNNGESIEVVHNSEPILLIKQGGRFYALQAYIPHLGERLSEGRLSGYYLKTLKSHIRFDIRTGEPVASVLVRNLNAWICEVRDDKVFISHPLESRKSDKFLNFEEPVVIVGAGAAGVSTALSLRQGGYRGSIVMISEEPVGVTPQADERTLESPESSSLILFNKDYYKQKNIELLLNAKVQSIDSQTQVLRVEGRAIKYSYCVLTTGSKIQRPSIPGAGKANVYYIKSLRDTEALFEKMQSSHRAVVIGQGLLGLEVAASLKSAGLEVVVVSEEWTPCGDIFGVPVGKSLQALHESNGVTFRLGVKAQGIYDGYVELNNGETLQMDFVVMATETVANTQLAEQAGCKVNGGIIVDRAMRTSVRNIFAAGEVAKFPSRLNSERQRLEHWEVAEHQGAVVAQNILGKRAHYNEVPYFRTEQFGQKLSFIGYSKNYDSFEVRGSLNSYKYSVAYYLKDEIVAILVCGNEKLSLMVEEALFEMDSVKAMKTINSFFNIMSRE